MKLKLKTVKSCTMKLAKDEATPNDKGSCMTEGRIFNVHGIKIRNGRRLKTFLGAAKNIHDSQTLVARDFKESEYDEFLFEEYSLVSLAKTNYNIPYKLPKLEVVQ